MPHYNFIEIGTSNFRTLIQKANDNTVGISVEPISYYLNQLPNKKNIIKENVAISFENIEQDVKIFYVPENIIIEKGMPRWMKGCNSLHNYHRNHLSSKIKKYVVQEIVKEIPISKLLIKYNVTSLDHLKIDTEGGDCDILFHLFNYIKHKPKSLYPKKITFETNSLTDKTKLKNITKIYNDFGYEIQSKNKSDTVIVFSDSSN